MKTTLKLSSQQLNTLVHSFNSLNTVLINDARPVKVSRSILAKVIIKFQKKFVEAQQTANLFSASKKKEDLFFTRVFRSSLLGGICIAYDQSPTIRL